MQQSHSEHASGQHADRPELAQAMKALRAGDTLVAGTIARLLHGQPFPQAAVFGMACAAARIQQIEFGLPPLDQVEALLHQINVTPC